MFKTKTFYCHCSWLAFKHRHFVKHFFVFQLIVVFGVFLNFRSNQNLLNWLLQWIPLSLSMLLSATEVMLLCWNKSLFPSSFFCCCCINRKKRAKEICTERIKDTYWIARDRHKNESITAKHYVYKLLRVLVCVCVCVTNDTKSVFAPNYNCLCMRVCVRGIQYVYLCTSTTCATAIGCLSSIFVCMSLCCTYTHHYTRSGGDRQW